MIPGLSVNYAIIYDFVNSNKFYPYFIVNVVGKFFFKDYNSLRSLFKKNNNVIKIYIFLYIYKVLYILYMFYFIAYLIGLFLAFIGLLYMNTAQPALFYLCPIILIFSSITALIRKEFKSYWMGTPVITIYIIFNTF